MIPSRVQARKPIRSRVDLGRAWAAVRHAGEMRAVAKVRSSLTSGEVEALTERLVNRLDTVIIETQPEVAARLLELVSDADAGLADFADVIRSDVSLSGRLLRMANSAFFGQRQAVTSLERAAVLLGFNRIRSLALGFYLSRSVDSGGDPQFNRRLWGVSLLRACLAAKLMERFDAKFYAEAFLVGLMLDAGMPLARVLQDSAAYDAVCPADHPPSRAFKAEENALAFTHVDVARALVRRWRIPDLLAKPIVWHHTPPNDTTSDEPMQVLHRIAFYVGSMHVEHVPPKSTAVPLPSLGERLLGITRAQLGDDFAAACAEYRTLADFFGQVAESLHDVEALGQRVHRTLMQQIERSMEAQIAQEASKGPASFEFQSGRLEVEHDGQQDDIAVAYLLDQGGVRQAMHRFHIGTVTAGDLLRELSIEPNDLSSTEMESMDDYLRALAA
ncbi:MAG: HDOD domain-containing protein [Planctomycetota bacterium]